MSNGAMWEKYLRSKREHLILRHVGKGCYGLFSKILYRENDVVLVYDAEIFPMHLVKDGIRIDGVFGMEFKNKGCIEYHVNHSCNSNCRLSLEKTPTLIALKDIPIGKELTYNYNSTQYDMFESESEFNCKCGEKECLGRIRGFRYLTAKQKKSIKDTLSPYLKSMIIDFDEIEKDIYSNVMESLTKRR